MAGKGNNSFWIPLSDLMTVLMVIFLFVAVSYMDAVSDRTADIQKLKKTKTELYKELLKEFKEDFKETRWNAIIDSSNLSIRFANDNVMFDQDKDELKPEFEAILADFFPRYLNIILKKQYRDKISEVRIEGHTSDEGTYEHNLDLSQRRTQRVMTFLRYLPQYKNLNNVDETIMLNWLTANGLSYGRTIDKDGNRTNKSNKPADKQKCRRVEFRIVTTSSELIDELNL
jgi:outer membrane protein OmpA-like peptidoglycan-associated protein